MLWLPHLLTLSRLAAAPLAAWLLFQSRFRAALLVVLVAGLTDWFDGYSARKLGATGTLGVILDPLADKILLVTLFIAMGWLGLIPFWLLLLAVTRDVVIVFGALLLRLLRNRSQFVPSLLGKISTFFQIVLVLLALVYAAFRHPFILWLKETAVILTTIFTAASWLDYIRRGVAMTRLPPLEKN